MALPKFILSPLMADKYLHLRVALQVRDKICGGIPRNPNIIEGWIKSVISDEHRIQKIVDSTKRAMGVDNLTEEQIIEEVKKSAWNSFKFDEQGLYIEGRQCGALLKENASVLRETLDMSALKARVAERIFVNEDRIYLGKKEPDGTIQGVVHAMTSQGPIAALKKVDYVERPLLEFTVTCLNERFMTKSEDPEKIKAGEKGTAGRKRIGCKDILLALLHHGRDLGLGADRSQGYGKFDIVKFEEYIPE